MKKLNKKANPSIYLKGPWNPQRAQIARAILEFPILGDGTRGHIYDPVKIAKDFGVSKSAVLKLQYALLGGAVPPTDEELALAKEKDISIPIDPNAQPPEVTGDPVPEDDETPAITVVPPEANPEVPPPTPAEMKEGVDKFLESMDHKAAAILRPSTPPPPDKGSKDKPLTTPIPDKKAWHNPPEAKIEPPAPKTEAPKEEAKPIVEEPKAKEPKDQKMTVGGGLFESVHKVKLDLQVLIWFYYNKNVHGFKGTLDDFLNWCVSDCVKARGLSLEIVEDPLGLIGAGLKDQMQQQKE